MYVIECVPYRKVLESPVCMVALIVYARMHIVVRVCARVYVHACLYVEKGSLSDEHERS